MLKHILILLLLKLPVQLIGLLILPIVTYKYQIGQFPKALAWFDDTRGRYLETVPKLDRNRACTDNFGEGHCNMYAAHKLTWRSRYIWTAIRNPVNGLQHWLGRMYGDSDIFQHVGEKPLAFGYTLRYNIGYKYYSSAHAIHMLSIGIPLQWVFSIGVRKNEV